jgi:hypothetical protein
MMMRLLHKGFLALLLSGLAWLTAQAGDAQPNFEFFESRIRPILTDHCYECHSVESEKVKGGLLLDSREALLKGGDSGVVLVPGDPEKSKLIIAVRHTDRDLEMPPKEKLSDQEIASLEEWVKMGAPDPRLSSAKYRQVKDIWSAKPIHHPVPPAVRNKEWARDPIDAFLMAALEKHQLAPVAPAGKSTLIRRATFDLIGLPPTPAEVAAFLMDDSDQAFARVIDRLLQSPHFGERWGRHWLDLARYADTSGSDFNVPLNDAWRYRDWVVNALNADMPYDQFIREQIAGDLLEATNNADRHQKLIATGFLVLGPKNFNENREKLLMDIADEQIDVTCKAFLGLTVSCARCHDHKFDPIPTRDYYAIAGIFRSTHTINDRQNAFAGQNFFSERSLGTPEEDAKAEEYSRKIETLRAKIDSAQNMARDLPGGIDSKELDGIVMDNLQAEVIGNWSLSRYSTNFVDKNYLHDGNEKSGKGKKLVRFHPDLPEEGFYEIRLAYTPRYNRATNVPVRVQTRAGLKTIYLNERVAPQYDKAFETLGVFDLAAGTNATVEISTESTRGFVVVDAVQFLPKDIQLAARYTKRRSPASENMMMERIPAAQIEELNMQLTDLNNSPPANLPRALAVRDAAVHDVRIHIRGDPENLGDEVPRGFLTVLKRTVPAPEMPSDSSGRLQLANLIASAKNPLTSRVMVNRIWQHLFGQGIVSTPDNFGSLGALPSHPELLDYLAGAFIQEGWSVKKMIRRLMLTRAYQLSSAFNAEDSARDPGNTYLWRMDRRRLDAESLRDSLLAVSGSLDPAIGGTLIPETPPRNSPPGRPLPTPQESNRRSLYLPVQRGALNDLFQVFDFPDPNALAGRRYVTTAPTQALYLMNSPFVIEKAAVWAKKLLADSGKTDADRLEAVYRAAYARPCSNDEKSRALKFLADYDGVMAQAEPDPALRKQKVWAGFCQAIFESAEFRFID